jgi:hypothetical protein
VLPSNRLTGPNNRLGNYTVHQTTAILTVGAAVTQLTADVDANGDLELFGIGADNEQARHEQSPAGLATIDAVAHPPDQ